MFREEFELGGPVMYVILAVWVLMLALILERCAFWTVRLLRARAVPSAGSDPGDFLDRLQTRVEHNLWRIDGLSQLATSLGLFGTVLGIARSFFARGMELSHAAPEVFASGLATALFTTVAGLATFLVGQTFLFLFQALAESAVRRAREASPPGVRP